MLLRVLSFNTWGVPVVSRDRAARMRAIGRAIAKMDVDIVGLQEVFYAKDRRLIAEAAAQGGLCYSHYFHSGVMGSGLLTLSRYPITETSFLRFRLNGRPQDFVRVDYYAGKGVGRARVETPGGAVDLYNVHLIAPYLELGPDRFAAHRVAQAVEMGHYIREQSAGVPAILVGDLNCYPHDATYRASLVSGGLSEPQGDTSAAAMAAVERSGYATIHPPDHYDYVLSRSAPAHQLASRRTCFVLGGRPDPNPDGLLGYSDHYGVLAEFELAAEVDLASASASLKAGQVPSTHLRTVVRDPLSHGIHGNRKQRRKARVVAAASFGSAALLRQGTARRFGPVGRLLSAAVLAALVIAGSLNLSTAARLATETRALTEILGEDPLRSA